MRKKHYGRRTRRLVHPWRLVLVGCLKVVDVLGGQTTRIGGMAAKIAPRPKPAGILEGQTRLLRVAFTEKLGGTRRTGMRRRMRRT
jgi:hypothetical protein